MRDSGEQGMSDEITESTTGNERLLSSKFLTLKCHIGFFYRKSL